MNNRSKILSISTVLPKYSYTQEEVLTHVKKWVLEKPKDYQDKALSIFSSANIHERHSIAPIDVVFSNRTIEDFISLYKKNAIELGAVALEKALKRANISPDKIDYIITTSCTGFMIPSFDAYVINALKMRRDVKKLPVTEIGCTAGATSLIYADDYLKAYPDHKVAIINLEFPSNTIQLNDYSWDNVIGTAIFADGVSAYVLGSSEEKGLEIISTQMYQVPNTTEVLNYELLNTGLNMKLDRNIPNIIANNMSEIVGTFAGINGLKLNDVDKFLVHPGGLKILDMIEDVLKGLGKNVNESRYIMETYGNLSSATLGFIVERYLDNKKDDLEETIIAMGFGPGFSAHQLLMKWK